MTQNLIDIAQSVIDIAKAAGGQEADVVATQSTDFEVKVADGKIDTLTQATSKGLGLRVFVDGRMGFCTTSDFGKDSLKHAVERAVSMAKEAAEDEFNGIADGLEPGLIEAGDELELYDAKIAEISTEEKIAWAHALEASARDVDPRVCKFRSSGVASGDGLSVMVTSSGAIRSMRSSGISLWTNPIAEENGELQTELWYDSKTHLEDLKSVEEVGKTAGERALRMLGAKPVGNQIVPVIFEPQMSAGLLRGILGAINGDMVFKKASFLGDSLGKSIAAKGLSVVDDPLVKRGTGSAPFDGEGLPTYKKRIIDNGVLTTFLYDSYTARKAGVKPTASARRGYSGMPHAGPFNFYVENGEDDVENIWKDVDKALVLTQGLGRGVNAVTGEYSRGANGLWIEKGEVVHAVQEVTIAGDFIEMLNNIDAIGSDFEMHGSSGGPTLRIANMTVSGQG